MLLWAGLVFIRSDLLVLKIEITGNTRWRSNIMESMRVQPGDNILQMSIQLLEERLLANPGWKAFKLHVICLIHCMWNCRKENFSPYTLSGVLEVGDNGQILVQPLDVRCSLALAYWDNPVTGAVGEYILDLQLLEKVKEICKALDEEN